MSITSDIYSLNGIEFRRIPFGDFLMGRLPLDRDYAHLNEPVSVSLTLDYYISTFPVTNKVYLDFLRDIKQDCPQHDIEIWDGEWKGGQVFEQYLNEGPEHPVVGVNFNEAQVFTNWLSVKSGLPVRLPTEAEFEYAARGRCHCSYHCANAREVRHLVRDYGDICPKFPPAVGRARPNSFGLYDMNGLIWHWCSDYFAPWEDIAGDQKVDPKGPPTKPKNAPWKGQVWAPGRVIKGGSFAYGVLHSRCGNRHYSQEYDRNFNLGFRLAFST